jgi:hypothetical protein
VRVTVRRGSKHSNLNNYNNYNECLTCKNILITFIKSSHHHKSSVKQVAFAPFFEARENRSPDMLGILKRSHSLQRDWDGTVGIVCWGGDIWAETRQRSHTEAEGKIKYRFLTVEKPDLFVEQKGQYREVSRNFSWELVEWLSGRVPV